jgi:trigger factor
MTESATETIDQAAPEMNVVVEVLSNVERKLAVELPWPHVKGRLDEAYRELSTGVQIKGFRRGKVPRAMLEKLFGKHVNKEVAQRLVQESIVHALKDHDLSPVSEPKVEDGEITDGESFRYSAVLQVVPPIDPVGYFDVESTRRAARAPDEAVEAALASKQRELTSYRAVEGRRTQAGDVALVDVMGKVGKEAVSWDNQLVELDGSGHQVVPGLAEKLTGIDPTPGTELDLALDVPVHDHHHAPGEPCSGHEHTEHAALLVTIKDVKQKVVPELNDDFARDTGEAESLGQLREVYRKRLIEVDEERALEEAKETLLDKILEKNDVPVVPALVERHLERMQQLQAALLGLDPRASSAAGDEELERRLRADAERTVRKALLIEAIAKKERIEVQEADLEQKLAELASSRGQNVARVRADYEKRGRLDSLRSSIREEKTLDLLISRATLVEVQGDNRTDEGR